MKKLLLLPVALLFTASSLLAQNPVPFVNQPIVPTAAAPGGAAFTLTVNGTGFVSGATIQWNGSALTTTFVNSSQLTAAVPASNIAAASTAEIAVANPTPGGGVSNVVFFPVTLPTRDVSFQAGPAVPGGTGLGGVFAVVTGDFTGTGKLDLVWHAFPTTGEPLTLHYSRGNGDGTFQSPVVLFVTATPPNNVDLRDIAVGDFNGDGKLDILATGFIDSTSKQGVILVFLGNGDGTFQPPIQSTFSGSYMLQPNTAVGDLNGDGKLDVVSICETDLSATTFQAGICSFLGNGNGTFALKFSRFYTAPLQINSIAIGDFNGDGKLDVLGSASYQTGPSIPTGAQYVGLLLGNGDGTFAPDQLVYEPPDANSFPGGGVLAAADLNHDRTLDFVFLHDDCGNARACSTGTTFDVDFFPGNGDGTFKSPITASKLSISRVTTNDRGLNAFPLFGDFNGDGNIDALTGSTLFLLQTASSRLYSLPEAAFAVGDFNGDGRLDVISAISSSPVGSYALQPVLQVPPPPDFDVAVSSNSQTVTAGETATFTVTITGVNGFNGVVTPSQTGFPAGTTGSYNPTTVTGSGTIVITITTSTSTPPGTYPLAGSLTSGSIVHSGTLTLVVN